MIKILSWNIQTGKGADGVVSLDRIAHQIQTMGLPDVICLQEVARGISVGDKQEPIDQVSELAKKLPDYQWSFGPAIDAMDAVGRWQFGNVVFSRLQIVCQSTHILPRPADADKRQMPRQATEVVLQDGDDLWRVITTHLEFQSAKQRLAQVLRIRELHEEAVQEQSMPPVVSAERPYQSIPRPSDVVICGDFNMLPNSTEYQALVGSSKHSSDGLSDAWTLLNQGRDYPPTCGVHDRDQWREGPHCRDFFFLGGAAKERVVRMRVDTETAASDHQPLMIELT